jgi:hypothetical protein
LAYQIDKPKSVSEIKVIATDAGLRSTQKWNVSSLLCSASTRAIRTPKGWELTEDGNKYIRSLAGAYVRSGTPKIAISLRKELTRIKDPLTNSFVEEAVKCFEQGLFRAAVVLSWVGAISLLYNNVINNKLVQFNSEAKKRYPKWKDAKTMGFVQITGP